ncbi:MAG: radical SAM protein [Candidatus Omnitrophota bacterium]
MRPRLRYLIFYATSRCNMRCEHCFYLDELNKRGELSVEEIEKTAQGLRPLDFLRITGGEPFLRQDLPEAAAAFYRLADTRRMGIVTNGSRPPWVEKSIVRLYELCPDLVLDVGVSIDGLEKTHDAIRKMPGAFQKAKETVAVINACQQRHPLLMSSLVITATSRNENELDELYGEISGWGVDRLSVNHVRGKVHDSALLNVSHAKYLDFTAQCERYHQEKARDWKAGIQRAKNRLAREAIREVVSGSSSRVACLAGAAIGVLYSDGEVNVCEMLDQPNPPLDGTPSSQPRLGNIRETDYDFYRLWHSENAQHCRDWIAKTNCSCTHECFLTASILFGKKNYPALAREWLRLSSKI